jgi:hypothetical protein
MKTPCVLLVPLTALLLSILFRVPAHAGGVTLITHGYNSDVNSWVSAMAGRVPKYPGFPGTNYTTYTITLTTDGTSYFYQSSRSNSSPASTDSGELIVKLDWSQMAGGSSQYNISTYSVAQIAAFVLLQTNSIADLSGHALAEFPLHFIGHSRGGSLIAEISRLLGTNGVWVDHLTSLDPHPLHNDGNNEPFVPTDASAKNTYANVLFADDYWQNMGDGLFTPNGEIVNGAYVRQLTNLSGGYSSSHSDVHLWYHGTIDGTTPASDTGASITTTERQAWWVSNEQRGTNTGFEYSLLGGADRLSTTPPLGPGFPIPRDGYNQMWDFGAGLSLNRTALATNNGAWPTLIRLNRANTNQIVQGQSLPLQFFYQWARPATTNATISFYLDNDRNPLNTNASLIGRLTVPGTSNGVNFGTTSYPLLATNASLGLHSVFALISGGGRSRFLYGPEPVLVVATPQPPTLDLTQISPGQFRLGVNGSPGQTISVLTSSNLQTWQGLTTNTLSTSRWVLTNNPPTGTMRAYFRATLLN